MLELLLDPQAWIAFITLIALELVLGIDNIIFISILVDKVPRKRREFTRMTGLFLAMFMRIALLFLLSWIVGLVAPLFTVLGQEISGRDLILIVIGVVLIADGFDHHVPKGYVYFAMAFAVGVEMLNLRLRKRMAKAAQPRGRRARR